MGNLSSKSAKNNGIKCELYFPLKMNELTNNEKYNNWTKIMKENTTSQERLKQYVLIFLETLIDDILKLMFDIKVAVKIEYKEVVKAEFILPNNIPINTVKNSLHKINIEALLNENEKKIMNDIDYRNSFIVEYI